MQKVLSSRFDQYLRKVIYIEEMSRPRPSFPHVLSGNPGDLEADPDKNIGVTKLKTHSAEEKYLRSGRWRSVEFSGARA